MPPPPIEVQAVRRLALRLPWQKPKRTSSAPAATGPASSTPELDAGEVEQERLRSLNDDLATLARVFPDVRPHVFRELLASFSGESRLYLVTEALLMNNSRVVQGRWRSFDQPRDGADAEARAVARGEPAIADHEVFRSEEYKTVVKAAFYEEFSSLSRPAIRGVLVEQNYSYTESRPLLLQLNSQSWRASLANLFYRRKHPSLLRHPLVTWKPGADDSTNDPVLRLTASTELNEELSHTLIEPVRKERIDSQTIQDLAMAEAINEEEAEAEAATYDCQCCFMPTTFERTSVCSDKEHYLCFRCLTHTMSEALYGQGWAQSIDPARCTVKCIAPASRDETVCRGLIPQALLKRAILCDKGGVENWQRFESKLLNDSLKTSQLPLSKCPFCDYAEIDVRSAGVVKSTTTSTRLLRAFGYAFSGICYACYFDTDQIYNHLCWSIPVFVVLLFSISCLETIFRTLSPDLEHPYFGYYVASVVSSITATPAINSKTPITTNSLGPPPTGTKFLCRNPICLTPSCLSCRAPWVNPHTCHPRLHASLRTHVEAALTAATTRTCPLCQLSFVKSSGCNKLECPCGYRMCYLCRKDVRTEGYAHFCGHFRASGAGGCPVECGRCDLYRDDGLTGAEGGTVGSNLEEAMEGVRRKAEEEWWEIEAGKKGEGEGGGGGEEATVRKVNVGSVGGAGPRDDTAKRRQRWGLPERTGRSYA